MKIGNEDVKLYLGSAEVEKIYLGTEQVYEGEEPNPYASKYLTIEAINAGDLTVENAGSNVFYYSRDNGTTWSALTTADTVSINANENVLLKAENPSLSENGTIGTIHYSNTFNVFGNIMSLIYGDSFLWKKEMKLDYNQFSYLFKGATTLVHSVNLVLPSTSLKRYCYDTMFSGCTSLTTAPELPATTLANNCYKSMFQGCTSLTTAPELPATTLASYCYYNMFTNCRNLTTAPELPATTMVEGCYYGMFSNCTSLTTAPELPATTLAVLCYYGMFNGCTSLTTAPELPATTLSQYCYQNMFSDCRSLNYMKCLATDISAPYCTSSWLNYVSSTGTFVKAASMSDWTRGVNGIPDTWNEEDDIDEIPIDFGGNSQ